jgi:hypothetical protein
MKPTHVPARYRFRVKYRLKVVECARACGIRAPKRHFGRSRKAVRFWLRGFERDAVGCLLPRYSFQRRTRILEEVVAQFREARSEHDSTARDCLGSRLKRWLGPDHTRSPR